MADEDVNLDNYRFSKSHEWVLVEDGIATVGISDFAQEQLGDVVAVELPEIDTDFAAGEEVALIDTVKKTEPIYTPVSGSITEVHEELEATPELINDHPYTEGWMFKLELSTPDELEELMDAAAYDAFVEEEEAADD